MLHEIVDTVIELNFNDEIKNYNFPFDELFGLKIIKNGTPYEFIIKLSHDSEDLIFFCSDDVPFKIISSKPNSDYFNQDLEIDKLTEKLNEKEEKISKIKSLHDNKLNTLNEMVISKDGALISLTKKIEELIRLNDDKNSEIQTLITDFNNATAEYESNIKKFKSELNFNESNIDKLNGINNNLKKRIDEETTINKAITENINNYSRI